MRVFTACSEKILLLLITFAACTCLAEQNDAAEKDPPPPLVQVNFYGGRALLPVVKAQPFCCSQPVWRAGESLCPYCARFLDTTAARIYDNGVMNITHFRYIPYGNAKQTKARHQKQILGWHTVLSVC